MAALVIDTALHCAQAALFESECCLAQGMRKNDRGQAEILLPLLEDLLKEARLEWKSISQVIVTVGPGVFTGIRTGIAVARALKLALDIPVIGVSTLHVLAAMTSEKNKSAFSLIDAHKNEVYAQLFFPDLKAHSEPMLLNVAALPPHFSEAGEIIAYPAAFLKALGDQENVQAVDRLDLHAALKCALLLPLEALPLYVRAPDALPQKGALLRRA